MTTGIQGQNSAWTLPSLSRTARFLLGKDADTKTQDAAFINNLLMKAPALADTVAADKRLAL